MRPPIRRTNGDAGPSPKESPNLGFFRLEPIESRSSSGEAHLSLHHVADAEPFLTQSKRPWVSRRKSRKVDPPWKKFVTTFRVAPGQVAVEHDATATGSGTPPPHLGVFEQGSQILSSIGSSSSVSSASSSDYGQNPSDFAMDRHPGYMHYAQQGIPRLAVDAKHDSCFDDHFLAIAGALLPCHREIHRSIPGHREGLGLND